MNIHQKVFSIFYQLQNEIYVLKNKKIMYGDILVRTIRLWGRFIQFWLENVNISVWIYWLPVPLSLCAAT